MTQRRAWKFDFDQEEKQTTHNKRGSHFSYPLWFNINNSTFFPTLDFGYMCARIYRACSILIQNLRFLRFHFGRRTQSENHALWNKKLSAGFRYSASDAKGRTNTV